MRQGDETRVHRHAVKEHGARAAFAFAAAFLGTGETTILAQHIEQPFHRMRLNARALPVQNKKHDAHATAEDTEDAKIIGHGVTEAQGFS